MNLVIDLVLSLRVPTTCRGRDYTVRDQNIFPQRNFDRLHCIFMFIRKFTMLLLANTF